MSRIILACLAPLLLLGCVAGTTNYAIRVGDPQSKAEQTRLDEQAALAVELAYKAARTLLETAADAGLIKGAKAARAAEADRMAFAAVQAARAAYRAGNAADYRTALEQARKAVAALISISS